MVSRKRMVTDIMAPKTFDLHHIIRPNILKLKPYRCARDDYSTGILLDANENSLGPSIPKSIPQAMSSPPSSLERYPDPHQTELKKKIAQFRNISSIDQIFLGVGSDEVIDLLFRVTCCPGENGDKVLITPPTYGMYQVCADVNDVNVLKVPLIVDDHRFQLNVEKIMETLSNDDKIKLVFICSPGNPTGSSISRKDICKILDHPTYKGLVVIDEAYIDFVCPDDGDKQSCIDLLSRWPNVVVCQTLSKSFGLAGIRLGMAVANSQLITILNNTKAPYNISTPTSLIAQSAFSSPSLETFRSNVAKLLSQREFLIKTLPTLPFISEIIGTNDANFVLARFVDQHNNPSNRIAEGVYKKMAEKLGVVVRFRGKEIGCEGCLRITVGSEEENKILIEKIKEAVQETILVQ